MFSSMGGRLGGTVLGVRREGPRSGMPPRSPAKGQIDGGGVSGRTEGLAAPVGVRGSGNGDGDADGDADARGVEGRPGPDASSASPTALPRSYPYRKHDSTEARPVTAMPGRVVMTPAREGGRAGGGGEEGGRGGGEGVVGLREASSSRASARTPPNRWRTRRMNT